MAGKVKKGAKGYGYNYADMGAIQNYIDENGMSYYQYIDVEPINGEDYIWTVPVVDGEEQKPIRGCKVVGATLQGAKNPAQEQGSALTYARRYSLMMAFGLAPVDDDGFACRSVKPTAQELNEIEQTVSELGLNYSSILKTYGCKYPTQLNSEQVAQIKTRLEATRKEREGNNE